jgi:hypothetical protein
MLPSSKTLEKWEECRQQCHPNVPSKAYLAFENFFSAFSQENELSVSGDPPAGESEEDFLQILSRFMTFREETLKQLDRFYEETERFRNTGSFEVIWEEFITDSNDN